MEDLRDQGPLGREASKALLLGYPIPVALRPLAEGGTEEVSMLASLISSAPRSSTAAIGISGEAFARTLERWVKAKEGVVLEQKVFRFRSLLASAVLGAVTSMIASLGPVLGSFNFAGGPPADTSGLLYGAAAMAAISSGMLGFYMSGRRFFVNVAVSLAVFFLVGAVASPLANVPPVGLWGVK